MHPHAITIYRFQIIYSIFRQTQLVYIYIRMLPGSLWENWSTKLINNFCKGQWNTSADKNPNLVLCVHLQGHRFYSAAPSHRYLYLIYRFPDKDLSNLIYCLEHPQVSSDRTCVEAFKQSAYRGPWHHNLWPAMGTHMTIQDPFQKRVFWNILALLQSGNDLC